jgi:MFS transporter, FHS family, L-fucose permease
MPRAPQTEHVAGAGNVAPEQTRYGLALALLGCLFFIWGFITVINNTLLPHLRAVLP